MSTAIACAITVETYLKRRHYKHLYQHLIFVVFLMKFCYFRPPLADRCSQSGFQPLGESHWGLPAVPTVGDKQQTLYRSWVTPGAPVATGLTADPLVQQESVSCIKNTFFQIVPGCLHRKTLSCFLIGYPCT